jgi:carbon monoxide dehydrogenase subunit G
MLGKALLVLAACSAALARADELPPVGAAPCIACRAPAAEPLARYTREDRAALEAGDVLRAEISRESAEDDLSTATRAESLIKRPPAQVWAVLTDFEHWPDFMPLVRETRIGRRAGTKLWVEQHYSIGFVPLAHTTIYELAPGDGRLSWQLDGDAPHDIAGSEGQWRLVSVGGGQETLVRYDARISAGRAVPEFVERMLRERSLAELIASLRTEVVRRYPAN